MSNLKIVKKGLMLTLGICLIFIILLKVLFIKIDENNINIMNDMKSFCESIKINSKVNEFKINDSIMIAYANENFIQYDQKNSSNPFVNKKLICMIELKDGKVINKTLK